MRPVSVLHNAGLLYAMRAPQISADHTVIILGNLSPCHPPGILVGSHQNKVHLASDLSEALAEALAVDYSGKIHTTRVVVDYPQTGHRLPFDFSHSYNLYFRLEVKGHAGI